MLWPHHKIVIIRIHDHATYDQGPVKGERCVPADIAVARDWIAQLKGISIQEVETVTTNNARTLFPRAFAV